MKFRLWPARKLKGIPYTAEQVTKMRDALREIDQLLESSKWYDGENAREALLQRLGSIVQRALP